MAKIGLTGATGGVGGALARAAIARGDEVRGLVRDAGKARELEALGVRLVRGDLGDARALEELARGVDVVVHAAAHVGDWGTRDEFERVNVDGTRNVVEAAGRAGVRRLVHVSSVAVYGRPESGSIGESFAPRAHRGAYEETKRAAEAVAFERGRALGIEVSAVRPTTIFGAGDRVFVPRVVRGLRANRALLIDGGRWRYNVVDMADVVDVILRCVDRREAIGEAFNLAASPVPTVREVFHAIADGAGASRPRRSVPRALAMTAARVLEAAWKLRRAERPPFITPFVVVHLTRDCVYDATKARTLLGWTGGGDPLPALRAAAATLA